jgi:hypothetical protein
MEDRATFPLAGSPATWDHFSTGDAAGALSAYFPGIADSPEGFEDSPENAASSAFVDQCLKKLCPTLRCAAHKCRRVTDKYPRGYVVVCDSCPKHVQTYLRCVVCQKTIHVGCDDGGGSSRVSWTSNWKCSPCFNQGASAVVTDVGGAAPTSLLQPPAYDAAERTATPVNDDATCTTVTYDDFESMHSALRAQGFHVKTTNYVRKHGSVTSNKSSQY